METETIFSQKAANLKRIPAIPRPERLLELNLSENLLILPPNAFQSFTRLRKLCLSDTGLTTLPLLPESLESLELAGNQLMRLPGGLKPCTALTFLDISRNLLSDLTPLARFRDLSVLHAQNNQIALLTGLDSLSKLTTLILDNNRVKDTLQIQNLPASLQFLSIRNTPVLRFYLPTSRLPGQFVSFQDGQFQGPKYTKNTLKSTDLTRKVTSKGWIDLGKVTSVSEIQSRSLTPDLSSHQIHEMTKELSLLKSENAALERKIAVLEEFVASIDKEKVVNELITGLEIDVKEYSFRENGKLEQVMRVLKERERERRELKEENEELWRRMDKIKGNKGPSEAFSMHICDLESQISHFSAQTQLFSSQNEQLRTKCANFSTKLDKFREKYKDLMRVYRQEAAKSSEFQSHLTKLQADYSKLLKANLFSALQPSVPADIDHEKSFQRFEERLNRLQSKVQQRPEEYYRRLKQCHRVIDLNRVE